MRSSRSVGEPQQQIAMTGFRRAEAQQIVAAQFIERAQQMVLIAQPEFVLGDNRCAIAAAPDPERIAPFAAASDVDSIGVAGAPRAC
jgi:hypothetical protein